MRFIATKTMTLKTDNSTAMATVLGYPSEKVFAGGLGVYKDKTNIIVTNATSGSFIQTEPVNGELNSGALKVKAENVAVLLEGDKTNTPVIVTLKNPQGAIMTMPITVTIEKAGQNKVLAS